MSGHTVKEKSQFRPNGISHDSPYGLQEPLVSLQTIVPSKVTSYFRLIWPKSNRTDGVFMT